MCLSESSVALKINLICNHASGTLKWGLSKGYGLVLNDSIMDQAANNPVAIDWFSNDPTIVGLSFPPSNKRDSNPLNNGKGYTILTWIIKGLISFLLVHLCIQRKMRKFPKWIRVITWRAELVTNIVRNLCWFSTFTAHFKNNEVIRCKLVVLPSPN